MKIAIVTLPLGLNYGGILQCYALQTVLQRMGHEVVVLEKPKYGRSYPIIKVLAICKRIFKRYLLGKDVSVFLAPHEIISQHIDKFIRRYIHRYPQRVWTSELVHGFDAFVVGSDQIWRPEYFSPIENAFLAFVEGMDVKRIAYAASFGVDQCTYTMEQLSICSALLKQFDAVSVREDSGVKICRESFGVEAVQMLDPTLLLDVNDYRKIISVAETKPLKGKMIAYLLYETDERKKLAEQIAMDRGLVLYWLNNDIDDRNKPFEECIKVSVEQWLRVFDEADYVFTDSFHGCIFSILFRKPFIVIGNKYRGMARFNSLLHLFSLNERLISSWEEYESKRQFFEKDIDFISIYEKLIKERNQSFNFIMTSLK